MRNARWIFNLYWKLSKRRSRINPPSIEAISPSPWFVSSENLWKSLKISPQKPSRNSEKLFFPPQRFLLEQIPQHPWLAFSTWYTQDHNVFVLAETFVFYPWSCEYSTHIGPELEFSLILFDSHRTKINTPPVALVWLSELIKVSLQCCTIKIALKILLLKSGLSERIKVSLRRCTWGPWLEFLWAGLQTEQRLKRSWRRSQSKRRIEFGHYSLPDG